MTEAGSTVGEGGGSGDGGPELGRLAEVLRGTKAELVGRFDGERLAQPGGMALPGPFPVPVPDADAPVQPRGDLVLETFMVGADGVATPTGDDPAMAAWWQPQVDRLVGVVRQAADASGIELAWPAWVSASCTPLDEVIHTPHLDDDQLVPTEGVGLVAIAASHAGPRLAAEPIRCAPPRAPAPIEVGDESLGSDPQCFAADRVVVFARFGQLHSGPTPDDLAPGLSDGAASGLGAGAAGAGPLRNLLVLRVGTVPSTAG